MAFAFVQEFKIRGEDRSTTNYDAIAERVDVASSPPDGLIVHTAGWDEENGVFRIFDVWESREHADRFLQERLQPALDQGVPNPESAAPPEREGSYDLHEVNRG
jgi:hypothetical protein